MLSTRLVRMIEDHAEELTGEVLKDLSSHPRTPAYHRLTHTELHRRVYDVYRNLGRWLGNKSDEPVEATYGALGRVRREEGIPLSEVVFALTLVKEHLWRYVLSSGLASSPVDLYQEEELALLVGRFFDKATYYAVKGYEGAGAGASASAGMA